MLASIARSAARRVVADRDDLQPVADQRRSPQQRLQFGIGHRGDAFDVEVVEGAAIGVAAVQDGAPGQAGLGAFQREHFEQRRGRRAAARPFASWYSCMGASAVSAQWQRAMVIFDTRRPCRIAMARTTAGRRRVVRSRPTPRTVLPGWVRVRVHPPPGSGMRHPTQSTNSSLSTEAAAPESVAGVCRLAMVCGTPTCRRIEPEATTSAIRASSASVTDPALHTAPMIERIGFGHTPPPHPGGAAPRQRSGGSMV